MTLAVLSQSGARAYLSSALVQYLLIIFGPMNFIGEMSNQPFELLGLRCQSIAISPNRGSAVRALVGLLLVAMIAAACGDSSSETTSEPASDESAARFSVAGPIEACALLTLEDLTSRGINVTTGPTAQDAGFNDECWFEPDDGQGGPFVVLARMVGLA